MKMQTMTSRDNATSGSDMQQCIQHCLHCYQTCLETVSFCLGKGGPHAERGHIRILHDCAEMCHTSANFMIRDSDMHAIICGLCAQLCERCAEDCQRLVHDSATDSQMEACATLCRQCAESCREMADSGQEGGQALQRAAHR